MALVSLIVLDRIYYGRIVQLEWTVSHILIVRKIVLVVILRYNKNYK